MRQPHKNREFLRSRARRRTTLGTLTAHGARCWPYIWPADRADLKLRAGLAVALMIASKLVTIAIPYAFKWATDALAPRRGARRLPLPACRPAWSR